MAQTQTPPQKMPKLVRLYIKSCLIGFGAAAAFTAMLLYFDLAGLWGLVANSDAGLIAVIMLFMLHGIVFAGVQFAFAIMSMAETKPEDDDKGRRDPVWTHDAIPVEVDNARDRRPLQ